MPGMRRSTMPRRRPGIAALRHRVHVTEDPAMTAVGASAATGARDGDSEGRPHGGTHACESHRGDFNEPFAGFEIRDKFRELAGAVLTPDGMSAVERAVDCCEDWRGMDELTALLHRHSRPS